MPDAAALEPAQAAPVGLRPRLLAWQVLQAVDRGAYADGALEQVLKRSEPGAARPLSAADRALLTELAYGTIRQQGLLNGWLDQLGKVPAARQPPKLRWVLQLGAYQLLFCAGIPASAAVNTAVELARQVGLVRLTPVVNGLLRELARRHTAAASELPSGALKPWCGLALPSDAAASLALRRSLPLWLAEALLQWLAEPEAEAVAAACNAPASIDLRVNLLRSTVDAVQQALAAAGVSAAPISDLACGLVLQGRSGDLRTLPGYSEGHWSVQDRSAQRVVELLDPHPGERILDACAAPGGKAIQIAERCCGAESAATTLWAVDRSEARLRRLQRNAERLGLAAALSVLSADATALPQQRPDWVGTFDRVLLDAPCSGLGTLARHADARWRMTPTAIAELALLQQRLLAALAPMLKPGGRLVYATCTMHPRENSDQIQAFLAAHAGWRLQQQWQRWPGDGDGFYAALLVAPA
ncbi:MAG: 16S rRNA (cytosine(967)-C(5))-methyltransferase [Prochlorococcaceae cyanobacterium]